MTKQKSKTGYLLEPNYELPVSGIEHRVKTGLTLVEMLIVVAVIAILATMIIGIASRIDNQAKEKGMKNIFAILEGALDEYKDFKDDFPEANDVDPSVNSEILYGELYLVPSSREVLGKIDDSLIKHNVDTGVVPPVPEIYDLWGTALNYRYDSGDNFPRLTSAGPDRNFGTPDDISNR